MVLEMVDSHEVGMECITNMYGLSKGDWTSNPKLLGAVDKAIVKFKKCTWASSSRLITASNGLYHLDMISPMCPVS